MPKAERINELRDKFHAIYHLTLSLPNNSGQVSSPKESFGQGEGNASLLF